MSQVYVSERRREFIQLHSTPGIAGADPEDFVDKAKLKVRMFVFCFIKQTPNLAFIDSALQEEREAERKKQRKQAAAASAAAAPAPAPAAPAASAADEAQKKARNLQKKLRQIDELQEKIDKGEIKKDGLLPEQISKLESRDSVAAELAKLHIS